MLIVQNPAFLLLVPASIALVYFCVKKRKTSALRFSSEIFLKAGKPTFKTVCSRYLWLLRLLVLVFLALALARFRSPVEGSKVQTEGIDIMLVLDTSTTMLAEDFSLRGKRVNRLAAVKDAVENFIKARKNDRMGIVAFAARPYTVSPLTLDHGWLLANLDRVRIGMIEDGTAIGSALSAALKKLKDSKAKSRIAVLLTDGMNNAGNISPRLAAQAAKALGVKVYAIGAGTKGAAPFPMQDMFGNIIYRQVKIDVDEEVLKEIASETGGKYFRATDSGSLKAVYSEIDRMEKSTIEEEGYEEYHEFFTFFAGLAIALLLIEVLLSNTVLRRIP